ncbi:LapA family protein [Desulforamulus aquiferis]|uniref:LapA family protein n=1 Tax=Desulforamulus aquiferis TaxID=1397668 RepID=A0AAW7ZCD0_9FIRM|nr:LapA family protein [Desulforamulus aquiferis]MDO7787047.1 LapA family protein [Desulforamulus aquiferis]RYD06554.1 hypothetical protein N752_02490 [Desulforamulus aquiferis]
MQFYFAIATLFSITVAIFATQNSDQVTISFLLWQLPSIPQVIVILGSALAGMVAALFFGLSRQFKLSKELKEALVRINTLDNELAKLKAPVEVKKIDLEQKNETNK